MLDRRSTGARLLALRSFGKLIQPVRSRSSQAGEIQRPGESGLDQQMIDEVRKFAAAETANGSTGMRSILQAVTWFIQQRWSDHAAVAALMALAGPRIQLEASADARKVGRWSHHDGPESEILSYRASPVSITRIAPGRDAGSAAIG